MNQQDIADRLVALEREKSVAYQAELARVDKERDSLRELCGGIGHVYRAPPPRSVHLRFTEDQVIRTEDGFADRSCCVCGQAET